MARTVIAEVTKGVRNGGVAISTGSLSTTDKYLAFDTTNTRTGIIITGNASNTATVTFYHGDGVQGVENGDITVSVAAGTQTLVCLESGVYGITTGEQKGTIKCKSTQAVTVGVVTIA